MTSPYDINTGDLDSLTQNVPAPGAQATFTNDAFGRCRVNYLSFLFTTDANAGDRHIRIRLVRGASNWTVGIANLVIPASEAWHCVCAPGLIGQAAHSANALQISIPDILLLEPGDVLQCSTAGLKAGDTFTLIHNAVLVFPILV